MNNEAWSNEDTTRYKEKKYVSGGEQAHVQEAILTIHAFRGVIRRSTEILSAWEDGQVTPSQGLFQVPIARVHLSSTWAFVDASRQRTIISLQVHLDKLLDDAITHPCFETREEKDNWPILTRYRTYQSASAQSRTGPGCSPRPSRWARL